MIGKTILELDDGWAIKLLDGYTQRNDIKKYYPVHHHKGYYWPTEWAFGNTVKRCRRCNIAVPKEALGFIELLKWEIK